MPASLRPASEVVVPLRSAVTDIPPVTRVRSTLVCASRQALDQRGLLATYAGKLDPPQRTALEKAVPGRWLEIELALAHYRAIDRLELTMSDQMSLGGSVGSSVHGTLVATMVRMAQGLGLTPWTGVNQYARLWDRLFMGGGLMVEKLGEREAVVSMYNLSLLAVPYFRVALRGMQESGLSIIWRWSKLRVSEIPAASDTSAKYRLTWV
jgi:hypothetical protein